VAAFDAPGRAPRSGNARKIAGATLPRDLARGKPRKYAVSAVRIAARRRLSTFVRDRTVDRLWKARGKAR